VVRAANETSGELGYLRRPRRGRRIAGGVCRIPWHQLELATRNCGGDDASCPGPCSPSATDGRRGVAVPQLPIESPSDVPNYSGDHGEPETPVRPAVIVVRQWTQPQIHSHGCWGTEAPNAYKKNDAVRQNCAVRKRTLPFVSVSLVGRPTFRRLAPESVRNCRPTADRMMSEFALPPALWPCRWPPRRW